MMMAWVQIEHSIVLQSVLLVFKIKAIFQRRMNIFVLEWKWRKQFNVEEEQ